MPGDGGLLGDGPPGRVEAPRSFEEDRRRRGDVHPGFTAAQRRVVDVGPGRRPHAGRQRPRTLAGDGALRGAVREGRLDGTRTRVVGEIEGVEHPVGAAVREHPARGRRRDAEGAGGDVERIARHRDPLDGEQAARTRRGSRRPGRPGAARDPAGRTGSRCCSRCSLPQAGVHRRRSASSTSVRSLRAAATPCRSTVRGQARDRRSSLRRSSGGSVRAGWCRGGILRGW